MCREERSPRVVLLNDPVPAMAPKKKAAAPADSKAEEPVKAEEITGPDSDDEDSSDEEEAAPSTSTSTAQASGPSQEGGGKKKVWPWERVSRLRCQAQRDGWAPDGTIRERFDQARYAQKCPCCMACLSIRPSIAAQKKKKKGKKKKSAAAGEQGAGESSSQSPAAAPPVSKAERQEAERR